MCRRTSDTQHAWIGTLAQTKKSEGSKKVVHKVIHRQPLGDAVPTRRATTISLDLQDLRNSPPPEAATMAQAERGGKMVSRPASLLA